MESTLQLFRPGELCKLLGISRTTLWRLDRAGELGPRVRVSTNAIAYRSDRVQEFIERRSIEPEPAAKA